MHGVVGNVLGTAVVRVFIANDMVVKPGLPGKIDLHDARPLRHRRFESPHDRHQIFRLWSELVLRSRSRGGDGNDNFPFVLSKEKGTDTMSAPPFHQKTYLITKHRNTKTNDYRCS